MNMSQPSSQTPPLDVPGADWAEQQAVADPARDQQEATVPDVPAHETEANEADVVEQHEEVFLDEEE
jgi:hypothetical protein